MKEMRLIDADALKKAMRGLLILQPPQRNAIFLTPDQFIDAAPTIDAVPMDWRQFDDGRLESRRDSKSPVEGDRDDQIGDLSDAPWKVISILQNEIQCVKDAEFCDRQCAKCKLVMEAEDIIAALECAIQAIKLCDASWTQRRNDHVKHTER